ncbi:hypothetical protein BD324DRAFT_629317 [Kockovaella imperatae]|uniref:HCP-like protein n=1 Tax=Kockovaella imperatae TaxID=4999 RepID=A0A1Y1UCU9_9TREE|nr:hypothetical protein BD324DRAFT_629317 [Kockovaella imperatae]ORX35868.1 hypothetical protein BD324DRAFT_629317 [Kockovaella imperatae]
MLPRLLLCFLLLLLSSTVSCSDVLDPCAPLREAEGLLKELAPGAYAHLDRKLGVSLTTPGPGPISTALRIFPRLLDPIVSRVPSSSRTRKALRVTKSRRGKIELMSRLLDEAEESGCERVWAVRGKLSMFPPRDIPQDLPNSFKAYSRSLGTSSDPEAQFMLGVFYATGIGNVTEDQGKALLYYTFSALQGYKPAQMALGYKYWAGIGVKEDCQVALDYYSDAAEKAYASFLGPPGGRALPLVTTRLSDRAGGIYGLQASWASSNGNALRAAVKASLATARGETEEEILEYYQYHSDRDSHKYTVSLGKLFYLGSVYPSRGGIGSGAERVGEIPQSFVKAREYFVKVARTLWPVDEVNGQIAPKRKLSKEHEDAIREWAMIAASFLGRMHLRGEGSKMDYRKAKMWYERAAEFGDKEAHNGLGIMHRDGLGVKVDKTKAFHYFSAAAAQDLAEAQVNLGKLHLEKGELPAAVPLLEVALRNGSPFEAFHLLARVHASSSRTGGRPGMCGVAVGWFKVVAERGSWEDDYVAEADRAWARGEVDNAMVGWMIGSEMGSEVAQNNVAFIGQDRGVDVLRWWIRSAAQDNVDSMVKVGDIYYAGGDLPPHPDYDHMELAANYYQTAADTQTSAMAYWNLGWMYEQGMGVPRDWHLAKRYYDMSGETSREAWPAVVLSLAGLYVRSWWTEFQTRGEIPGLRFFEPDESSRQPRVGLFARLKEIIATTWIPPYLDEYDDGELYEDVSGSGWTTTTAGDAGGGVMDEGDEDLMETVVILGVALVIMGLVWLRGLWIRWEADRVRREEERRRREQQGAN